MVTISEKREYTNMGIIVAMGENREIGYQNDLIWRIKDDLDFFKNVTMGSHIIMGRKTYDSMPKNLKGRKYIVLSRNRDFSLESPNIACGSIDEVLTIVKENPNSMYWVIGGGTLYELFLPFVCKMHITKIEDKYPNADTYFPEFNIEEWYQEIGEKKYSEESIPYSHRLLLRKK